MSTTDDGSPVGRVVRSRKLKLDGAEKTHTSRVVRRGPEGVWLFSPAGTEVAGSDGLLPRQPADGAGIVDVEELAAAEDAGLVDAATAAVARDAADELYRALRHGYQRAFDGLGWRLLAEIRGRPADEL